MNKKFYFIKCLLLSVALSGSFLLKLDTEGIVSSNKDTGVFLALILAICFFTFFNKYLKNIKNVKVFSFVACLLSIFLIFGYSYAMSGSASLVFGNFTLIIFSLVKLISFFYMFKVIIALIYEWIIKLELKENKIVGKLGKYFNEHPYIFSFIFILICYLPYIIAYYPGIICNDSTNQLKEFMGEHTRYMDSIVPIDPNVTITNFNPVLHTILVGGSFKIGNMIGNNNLGLFLYTIIQAIIMISIFSYAIYYMKKEKVNKKLLYITLGIFAFIPVFPFYTITNVKDSLFTVFILLYIIQLYDLIKNKGNLKKYIILFLVSILVIVSRNNGIITILFSMPFLIIVAKDKRKECLLILTLIIAITVTYTRIILPGFSISDTSVREALSIPFQQTARLVKYHDDIIDEEDKKIIDKVLIYDTLAGRYDPEISDPVKNRFNKHATDEDVSNYFKVWFKYLLEKPGVYINATASNIYGYFYPNTSSWYLYHKYNDRLENTRYHYEYNDLNNIRFGLKTFAEAFPFIPIIGLIVNIGFVVWIYIFMLTVLMVNKKSKYIPVLLPAFSLMLVCVASPVNTYFRYAMPFIFSLPVVMFLLYNILEKNKIKKD